jgi:hypothetical protein
LQESGDDDFVEILEWTDFQKISAEIDGDIAAKEASVAKSLVVVDAPAATHVGA